MRILVMLLLVSSLIGCSEKPNQALGTLEWDRVNGRAIVSENIIEIYVKEGDQVTENQALLKLDSRMQLAQVKRAEGNVRQAEWKLNQRLRGAIEKKKSHRRKPN